MITYKTGNIFREDVDAVVNTVNCVGIMGRGIALQSKRLYPDNYKAYEKACKASQVHPGKMFVYEAKDENKPKFIINFPTKRHWRSKSRIQDIEKGLQALVEEIKHRNIKSIAIPPLGSGLGGLKWSEVRELINSALKNLGDVDIVVFEPIENIEEVAIMQGSDSLPKMTTGRAALISLIDRYLSGLMDPFVTLLEVHKLMYFMQEAGEPLRLKFKKATYGPYAENLRHVLRTIEGYYTKGYFDGGDQPDKKLELSPGALDSVKTFFESKEFIDTKGRLERVVDLVDGFETPFGLELLSTVHWVVRQEKINSIEEVIKSVYSWSNKKKQFSERQIEIAYNILQHKGWLN